MTGQGGMDPGAEIPGASFGEAPVAARPLAPGLGLAVARRTVFRPDDREDWGRVADRVAAGNLSLLGHPPDACGQVERARLRNAIATGALLTSGRHLQHGDADQAGRPMELFTNCATAIASFAVFYLLLNGAGVGRAYDDALMAVDWAEAPTLLLHLSPAHPDHPRDGAALRRFGLAFEVLAAEAPARGQDAALVRAFLATELLADPVVAPSGTLRHRIADSREGWAKAIEILEAMAFRRERDRTLLLDLSAIRPAGAPIRGLQGRPAPGPLPLLRALIRLRRQVIAPARARDPEGEAMRPWEQALRLDHLLSAEVQAGGTRRAARMATKSWRDLGALRFATLKREGGLWTANHSLMVDREFWDRVRHPAVPADPLTAHAVALFEQATASAHATGEPGFINADRLEDARTGSAWRKPVRDEGAAWGSARYRVEEASGLMAELSRRAGGARFPVTTNPCGEVVLHVTGGYCAVADVAPLLACPVPFDQLTAGGAAPALAAPWDARVEEALRLGVRFLVRVNLMDALYAEEVRRTNRIGIGLTGLHEWAWARFGLGFRDLLDEAGRGRAFWAMLARLGAAAKEEASAYAAALGRNPPLTVTTVKPSGTVSKLFGLSEGAHLPARRRSLRWVQFRGARDEAGGWRPGSDPLLAEYEARGYPVRALRGLPGTCIIGFPTEPLTLRLGMGERLVTAEEATPEEQFRWLRLLERHWIGAARGNQASYTLRLPTDRMDLGAFRRLLLEHQPEVRGCAVLPLRPAAALGQEYLPEEEVPEARFRAILAGLRDPGPQGA